MEYKNYKWKFANSMIMIIGIVYSIFFILFTILLLVLKEYQTILLVLIVMLIALILTYFLILLIGNLLYHRTKFSITDDGIIQNKRLLKYDNIKEISFRKLGSIYLFQMLPIKDGAFISKKIVLYFYSLEEVIYFILENNFAYCLTNDDEYILVARYINSIIEENGENLAPLFKDTFMAQKKTCPCCQNKTLFIRITNDICPVCFWEDDNDKGILYNPNTISEVNHISLTDAIRNYKEYNACEKEFQDRTRLPFSYEKPDYKNQKEC